ncbi:hypothetical protein [Mycolicibacterium diernhoferi]|nr:hypothetical protein [Mycolicibacterium diernhoferi]
MTTRAQASTGRRQTHIAVLPVLCAKLVLLGVVSLTVTVSACPPVVGLACLAILVLITGSALTQLLLGESRRRPMLADPLVRLPLTVVFGTVSLLAVVLALHFGGVRIGTTGVTAGTAAMGAALVIGQGMRRLPRFGPRPAELIRPALASSAAAAVLAVAVVAAIALQPKAAESYTTLTFADQSWLSEASQRAVAAEPVTVGWILRSFGYLPDPALTAVEVALDGGPLTAVAVVLGDFSAAAQPGDPIEISGSVTFAAPDSAGLHRVSISVYPHSKGALHERLPVTLTGWIEVAP